MLGKYYVFAHTHTPLPPPKKILPSSGKKVCGRPCTKDIILNSKKKLNQLFGEIKYLQNTRYVTKLEYQSEMIIFQSLSLLATYGVSFLGCIGINKNRLSLNPDHHKQI